MKNAKKILSLVFMVLVMMIFFVVSASALEPTGQCGDNVYWEFDETTGELVISGEGEIENGIFRDCHNINTVVIADGITKIWSYAFFNCTNLEKVTLPNYGIIIEYGAFENTAIINDTSNYDDGVLYIDNHLIAVDRYTLPNNYSVKDGTKSIASKAFSDVGSISDETDDFYHIYLPDSIEVVGYSAFFGNVYNGSTFCLSSLPANIKYIGAEAFNICEFVESDIIIPADVEIIKYKTFYGCDLNSITISEGVKEIGYMAFAGHFDEDIYIPASVEEIGERAFIGAYLKSFAVADSNPNYCSVDGILYSKDKTELLSYPRMKDYTTFNIPDGTKTIAANAFYGVYKINKLIVPSSVTLIEGSAFYGSYVGEDTEEDGYVITDGLKEVVFETGNRNLVIDTKAFEYCYLLENIVLPEERVYAISTAAFYEAAYMYNEDNWEDGVLYLGEILLAFNFDVAEEYKVKEGTTVIADLANAHGTSETEDGLYTHITYLPDSLVILGADNYVMVNNLPNNIKRIGYDGLSVNSEEILAEDNIYEIYGDYINGVDISDSKLKEMVRINYVYDEWLTFSYPYGMYIGIYDELFVVDEGIIGITEDGWLYDLASFAVVKGIILPKSIECLSAATPMSYGGISINGTGLSITFLNKGCEIFDDESTINSIYTICGYSGSTAEAYAKKYGRQFIDIENCDHSATCKMGVIEVNCRVDGRTGDTHCQYCGILLSKGQTIPKAACDMGEWETIIEATCSATGEEKRTCKDCNREETRTIKKEEHQWNSYNPISETYPTCTENGKYTIKCYYCSATKEGTYDAYGHCDYDDDGYCDRCDEILNYARICSCNCHAGGIKAFFFKLINFFAKLFNSNKRVCACGVKH